METNLLEHESNVHVSKVIIQAARLKQQAQIVERQATIVLDAWYN